MRLEMRLYSLASRSTLAALLLVAAGLAATAAPQPDGTDPTLQEGRLLYRIHCQSCHGPEARGKGPLAEHLRVDPPNLRRIARRRGGAFPSDEVARIIDGRTYVPLHGAREMPVWGLSLLERESDTTDERDVEARIGALVAYLRSIQRQ